MAKFVFVIAIQSCQRDQMLSNVRFKLSQIELVNKSNKEYISDLEYQTQTRIDNDRKMTMKFLLNHIGNPVNRIMLSIDEINHLNKTKSSSVPDKLTKALKVLKSSSNSMSNVCSNIITLEELQTGKFQIQPIVFNIAQMVIHLVHKFKQANPQFDFQMDLDELIPPVIGDKKRIVQILSILIQNAIHYSDKIEQIKISFDECSSSDYSFKIGESSNIVFIKFSVKDFGIGIKSSDKSHIFEPFVNITKSDKFIKEYKSGLSLSLASKIVQRLDGSIGLLSEFDQGSTFFFEVPLEKCNSQRYSAEFLASDCSDIFKIDSSETNYTPIAQVRELHKNVKLNELIEILIIDDDKMTLKLCKNLFDRIAQDHNLKINIQVATNGQLALDILSKQQDNQPTDIICIDYMMPVMDGLLFFEEFVKCYNQKLSTICLMSSNSDQETIKKFNSLGVNEIISKPINLKKLEALLLNSAKKKKNQHSWDKQLFRKTNSTKIVENSEPD